MFKKKNLYEIFLATDTVNSDTWSKLICEVGKLNGIFRSFKIYVKIEKSIIKYYLITKRKMPTVLNQTGDFLIKKIEKSELELEKTKLGLLYFVKNNEKNIIDIYNKNESKYMQTLNQIEIKIRPFKKNNYFSKTWLYFRHIRGLKTRWRAIFFIPSIALDIDLAKNNRFTYKKNGRAYLEIYKSACLFNENKTTDNILKIDAFPYSQENYYLNLNDYDFDKHSLIVGGSGSGKSKFIAQFIKSISENEKLKEKYKIVLIDPHSSIENDIDYIENSKVINMKTEEKSCNILINDKKNVSSSTEIMLKILKNIIGDDYNSKLERVLRHSIYFLIQNEKMSFDNLRKLLLDTSYRNDLLKNAEDTNEHIKEFFAMDYVEIKTSSYTTAISPIISLIDEMQMLPSLKNENNKKIEDIIDENFLTIFSLNQTELGEKVTKITSGLIMGVLFELIQMYRFDKHIIFIIDEIAVLENPILRNLLSEARKYNLSLMLSEQYFGQVSDELKSAIASNVMNYYAFRVSREDAISLTGLLQMELAVRNTIHNKVKMLTQLSNRECVVRASKDGRIIPAFKARTIDFKPMTKARNQIIKKCDKEIKIEIGQELEFLRNIKVESMEDTSEFTTEKVSIKDIMSSQSTSRKKVGA